MRSFIIVFIVVVIIITTLFFWQDIFQLDVSKPINYSKVGSYFTSLGSIATVITIWLIYRQISAGSKPELYPNRSEIELLELVTIGGSPSRHKYEYRHVFGTQSDGNDNCVIAISNIGLGPAKDVSIEWKYEIEELDRYLQGKYTASKKNEVVTLNFLHPNKSIFVPYSDNCMQIFGSQIERGKSSTESSVFTSSVGYDSAYEYEPLPQGSPDIYLVIRYLDLHENIYIRKFKVECAFKNVVYEEVTEEYTPTKTLAAIDFVRLS